MGSDATAVQEPPETVASNTARMMPERTALRQFVKTAATASPTESEIAAVAYQLWVNNGCPAGSDKEDWFRAEAMLKDALVAKCEKLSRHPPIPRCDTRAGFEMLAEFRYEGHWEVWEREWGGARWTWDLSH
jgi:hypothetical protein